MVEDHETVVCTVNPAAGSKLGMKLTGAGAPYTISSLSQDGVAATSGLHTDDRIMKVDEQDVSRGVPLAAVVKAISAQHDSFTITVRRATGEKRVGMTTSSEAKPMPTTEPTAKPKLAPGPAVKSKPAKLAPKPKPAPKPTGTAPQSQTEDQALGKEQEQEQASNASPQDAADAQQEGSELVPEQEAKVQEQQQDQGEARQELARDQPDQHGKQDEEAEVDSVQQSEQDQEHAQAGVKAASKSLEGITLNATHTEESIDTEQPPCGKQEEEAAATHVGSGDDKSAATATATATAANVTVKAMGSFSTHGTRHGDVNQDVPFTFNGVLNGAAVTVAAVFDGHGLLGEVAAAAARDKLTAICEEGHLDISSLHADPSAFMASLFEELNAVVLSAHDAPPRQYVYVSGTTPLSFELKEDASPDLGAMYVCPEHDYMPPRPIDFGCTAVVAVVHNDRVVIGNAGDADAVALFQHKDDDPESRDGCLAISHTSKHTATSDSERERVERDFPGAAVFTPDGYIAPTDPVLCQYELQLTRSLGHKLLRSAGLIASPDVHVIDLSPTTALGLVVCSDGVTDELQPFDMLDRVLNSAGDVEDAAQVLCKDAQDYCMDEDKVDDATAVVVLLAPSESCA